MAKREKLRKDIFEADDPKEAKKLDPYKFLTQNQLEEVGEMPDHDIYMHDPAVCDHEIVSEVLYRLEKGNYLDTAANCAGIEPDQLSYWLEAGVRGESKEYRKFLIAARRAVAKAEANLVETIEEEAQDDWRAAAFILERRHSRKWGKKTNVKFEDDGASDPKVIEHRQNVADQVKDKSKRDEARKYLSYNSDED